MRSLFDWTIFKKNITRFWPLWGGYTVFWLIILPLQGLMELRSSAAPGGRRDQMEYFANSTVPGSTQGSLYLAVIVGVLAAMAVFSHLYSAKSANLFGSLPIRRAGLFLTHYLAGLAFLLVPNLLVFLLTLLVEAAGGCVVMEGLLFWLWVTCGECFFFYSMAVFCAMFTGHILALPAFYGIFNVLASGVMMLLGNVLSVFCYGFAGFNGGVSRVTAWLTPALNLGRKVVTYWAQPAYEMAPDGTLIESAGPVLHLEGQEAVGMYVLAGLVLAACAFLLYRVRHMESAGDVVSVKLMRPVFKYGVAVCAGLLLGSYTQYALSGGEFTLMACILVWGLVGYFAAQMLLDKSFRVFKKWKGAAGVAGVFVVLFLVVALDLTGFEGRVPAPSSVESVVVDGLYSAVSTDDSGDRVNGLLVTDPEQIRQIIAVHQAAVSDKDDEGTGYNHSTRVDLTYTLSNGSTMRREYWLHLYASEVDQEGSAAWAVEQLYQNREFYWRVYGFDELERVLAGEGRLDTAELYHYEEDYGDRRLVVCYGPDARKLLDAVEADFRDGYLGVRTLRDSTAVTYEGSSGPADTMAQPWEPGDRLAFRAADPEGGTLWQVEVSLTKDASRTLDVLEDALDAMGSAANSPEAEENRTVLAKCLERLGR